MAFDNAFGDDGANTAGRFLGALGASILSGNRLQPFGNLGGFIAAQNRDLALQTNRDGLRALLLQAGATKEQAEQYSTNEKTTQLALEQLREAKFGPIASQALGGQVGPISNLGMGGASPANAGTQIPGTLSLNNNNTDVAVRTVMAEAGNQGPEGMKAVAGVLRNRALLGGTSVAAEALKPNQFEPWNKDSGNDPRRFDVNSPEYQQAKALILPVLNGEAPDPTGGATHFYAPKAQAALGRPAPAWDNGSGADIGDHRFFRLPYGQGGQRQAPVQVADASGGVGGPPASVMGVYPDRQPARQPVQVASSEADVQRLEQQMGMVPQVAQQTAQADAPAPGSQPVGFTIPGTGRPAPATEAQARFENARRISERGQLQKQFEANERNIVALSPAGDRYRGVVDVLKTRNAALEKRMTGLDAAPDGFERDPADPYRLRAISGGPRDPSVIAQEAEARGKENTRVRDEARQREEVADQQGFAPGSIERKTYIATGKLPRDEPLSAGDKQAIQEAEDASISARTTMSMLGEAKGLSKKAYAGPLAGWRGYGASFLGSESGIATADLDNLVTTQALQSLKSIFGAAPTEGERKILLDIQGSVNQPDVVRQRIYDRAIQMAEKRAGANDQRARELRGRTYYQPGGGQQGEPATPRQAQEPVAQAPSQSGFARPDLEAEARRRGLIK